MVDHVEKRPLVFAKQTNIKDMLRLCLIQLYEITNTVPVIAPDNEVFELKLSHLYLAQ